MHLIPRISFQDKNSMCRFLNENIENSKFFASKKRDRTSTVVGIIDGDVLGLPHNLFLKRFNYKGFFDFLVKRVLGSKAKRLWKISLKLLQIGLPVPKPLAFIEPSFSIRHSFFLFSIIENSENLHHAYKKGLFDKNIARQLAETITKWHMAGAVHGDMKWSNILLQKDGDGRRFFFVDLDQAKLYSKPNIKGIIKDLTRFYRSGLELGAEEWVSLHFFPEYLAVIPDEIKIKIDIGAIKNKALRQWHKKGQRRY